MVTSPKTPQPDTYFPIHDRNPSQSSLNNSTLITKSHLLHTQESSLRQHKSIISKLNNNNNNSSNRKNNQLSNQKSSSQNNNDSSTKTPSPMNTNIGKPIIHMKKWNSQIYFRILTNNKVKDLSALFIDHVLLKASQLHDPSAELLTSPATDKPQLSFTEINTSLNGDIPQARTYNKIFKTDKNNWYGNFWITSDIAFTLIVKQKHTKDLWNQLGKVTMIINDINANPPTETGFFIHHLVRHDTVLSKCHLQNILPIDCPTFQQDICTLWAGTKTSRRGVGVMKIYSHPNEVHQVSKIFSNTFQDSSHMFFIRQDIFSSLEPSHKIQYIDSQYQYSKKFRTILLDGFKNYNTPTLKIDEHGIPLTIK